MQTIFNAMLETGCFPDILCNALIVPVHKKGSLSEPQNFRGISCMTKLFTSVLNMHLLSRSEDNDVLTDAQFGFWPHHSTVDTIFALNTIIEKHLKNKSRLYCCFIDFKQAFDSVDRNKLWCKISQLGIRGKILRIIKSFYSKIKTSVLLNDKISEPFMNHLGLLQGEIMSPILFSYYLNDCEMDFLKNGCDSTELQELSLFLLMYADDMVIFSRSISGLQEMLNSLSSYTAKWSLAVNIEKTKTVIFRNGGNEKADEIWFYDSRKLDIVNEFCNFGIVLNYNAKFSRTQKQLSLQCRKAMFGLKRKCSQMNFNHMTLLTLFDTYVASIANYGSEIWGFHSAPDLEKVHLDFCKSILGVKRSTPNPMVYCELGRLPLICYRKLRIIKYWLKLKNTKNCILKSSFEYLCHEFHTKSNCKNWIANVFNILSEIGLRDLFLEYNHLDAKLIFPIVKQRIIDIYKQSLITEISSSSKCFMYKHLIDHIDLQTYLKKPIYNQYKKCITRLRLSSHCLSIETGRYKNIPLDRRICPMCKTDVEDEFHFVL